ncbi:hypothetical protein TNCV_4770991 [Trichonephila clavipes]|nr:hypothetical protein TNCV_4770991 [Trichonephila clavipes]
MVIIAGTPKHDIQLAMKLFCHGFSRETTERNDFQPSGVAIDTCQQEGDAVRWWKWSNQIDMDVLKSFNGWSKMLYGAHGMPLDFESLACDAASCPFSDVLQHGLPVEAVLDEALCGTNTWGWEILWKSEILQSGVLPSQKALPFHYSHHRRFQEDFPFLKVLI